LRRSASSKSCEREYAPQSNSCASGSENHAGKLLHFNAGGPNDAGPRQETSGYVDEHQADEQDSVRNCTGKNKQLHVLRRDILYIMS